MNTELKPKNKLPLLLFSIIFYFATVLPHEIVGTMIGGLFKEAGRAVYESTMLSILGVLVTIYAIFIVRSLMKHPHLRIKGSIYLIFTLLGCFASMSYLIIANVEAIHFVQYALLAVLVFLLTKRYDYTIWIILFMAFLDESYQHFFLTPNRFAYLDFNDMFLDLVGGGFGLTSLYCLNHVNGPANKPIRKGILFTYIGLIILGVVLYATGVMRIWPTEGEELATIQIYQQQLDGFWTTVRKVKQFHIMRPLEGIAILLVTAFFYSRLGD